MSQTKSNTSDKIRAHSSIPHIAVMGLSQCNMEKPEQDLQSLREILFGDQLARFDALDATLEETKIKLSETEIKLRERENKLRSTEKKLEHATDEINRLYVAINQQQETLLSELNQIRSNQIYKNQILDIVESQIPNLVKAGIDDSQPEMIDALYPLMGKLVTRSVTQSMRDLARNIDAQMRKTFNFSSFTRNIKARATGISGADIALRDSLPFGGVEKVFLVHYETSVLLQYLSREVNKQTGEEYFITQSDDSELVSSMLTAVQDFVADAFGEEGEPGSFGDFQHGQKQVLIKAARLIYMAVVIRGVAPSDFGSKVQDHVYEIESQHAQTLREFDGNVSTLDASQLHLQEIMNS